MKRSTPACVAVSGNAVAIFGGINCDTDSIRDDGFVLYTGEKLAMRKILEGDQANLPFNCVTQTMWAGGEKFVTLGQGGLQGHMQLMQLQCRLSTGFSKCSSIKDISLGLPPRQNKPDQEDDGGFYTVPVIEPPKEPEAPKSPRTMLMDAWT